MKKQAMKFDVRRPVRKAAEVEAFVAKGATDKNKPVRQNLWIDPSLRIAVGVQSRKNGESISAFATRAFKRELIEPSDR